MRGCLFILCAMGLVICYALADGVFHLWRAGAGWAQTGALLTGREDVLIRTLARCHALADANDDPRCRAAWEESGRRLFHQEQSSPPPAPSETGTLP